MHRHRIAGNPLMLLDSAGHDALMTCSFRLLGVCFNHAPASSGFAIFGFAEFLTALALLVVVFNSGDFLYKFRISVAALPLRTITFISAIIIGAGTLRVPNLTANTLSWMQLRYRSESSRWMPKFPQIPRKAVEFSECLTGLRKNAFSWSETGVSISLAPSPRSDGCVLG